MRIVAAFLVLVVGVAFVHRRSTFGRSEESFQKRVTGPSSCRSTAASTFNTPLDSSNPQVGKLLSSPFKGLREEFKTRKNVYRNDWTVVLDKGSKKKVLSTILFLYFACLAPTGRFFFALHYNSPTSSLVLKRRSVSINDFFFSSFLFTTYLTR